MMRFFVVIMFIFFSCATTSRSYYVSVYAESKPELNAIIKDLKDKKIKYKIVEYPSHNIYEIMYEEAVDPK